MRAGMFRAMAVSRGVRGLLAPAFAKVTVGLAAAGALAGDCGTAATAGVVEGGGSLQYV